MPISTTATRILRLATFAAFLASSALLAACGSGSSAGTSSFLPPGPATTAPPGNLVLYVAMAQGNRIDAFRLGSDGLLPEQPFDSIAVDNPRRLAIANGTLYASLIESVVSIRINADGSLPAVPTTSTLTQDHYEPIDLEVRNNVLYVASSGLERVQSFRLDDDGGIPPVPTGSGAGQIPGDFVSLAFDGDFLYAGARGSDVIELFILDPDGDVPLEAEQQIPQDFIALPDDIIVRDDILYVTSASDQSIRAYRLQGGGFLPTEQDSRTNTEEFYSSILIDGDRLYATAYNAGRIDLYEIEANGLVAPRSPLSKTQDDPETYPSRMVMNEGILYVAQAGIDRVDAYVLDPSGVPPFYPSSSTDKQSDPSYPLDLILYSLD